MHKLKTTVKKYFFILFYLLNTKVSVIIRHPRFNANITFDAGAIFDGFFYKENFIGNLGNPGIFLFCDLYE